MPPLLASRTYCLACLVWVAALHFLSVATLVVLQSVARNVEVPILALLIAATLSAKVQSVVVRIAEVRNVAPQIAVTPAWVPNVAVLNAAPRSLVRNAVPPAVVPSVAAQSVAIQFWFPVVTRVAPIVVLISVPYAARRAVNRESRVHDVPLQASRVTAL